MSVVLRSAVVTAGASALVLWGLRRRRAYTKRAYARVGLVGNPSDGFFGKTIAVAVENFWAEVSIRQSAAIRLVPNPIGDAPWRRCSRSPSSWAA